MSIAFLFNFVSYALPFFASAILGSITQPVGLVLSVLHPFSIGLAITNVVYPGLYSSPLPPRVILLVPRYVPPLLCTSQPLVISFSHFSPVSGRFGQFQQ